MILRTICEPQIVLSEHTCCRCGAQFQSPSEMTRVCGTCRRPKVQVRLKAVAGQRLSHREGQVTELVAQGLPNKEIGFRLHLSEGTIKVYLFHIFRKTRTANRTELAVWQVRGGFLPGGPDFRVAS